MKPVANSTGTVCPEDALTRPAAGLCSKTYRPVGLFLPPLETVLTKSEHTVESILDHARKLFIEKSYADVTMAEIKEYFHDKYERLKAFLQQAIDGEEDIQCAI